MYAHCQLECDDHFMSGGGGNPPVSVLRETLFVVGLATFSGGGGADA